MSSGATSPEASRRPRRTLRSLGGAFRYSAVELLAAIGLLFISAPFVEDLPYGDLIEAVLMTLVMASAVLAVGGSRRNLAIALVLFSPALATKWLHHLLPGLLSPLAHLVAAMCFFAYVIAHLLRFILRAPRVDANVLCAGLSGYLLLGLLWLPAYVLVGRLDPTAFALGTDAKAGGDMSGFHAFYFSFITLCTVGYGDVTPLSKVARMLAVMEAITGLFYVTVLISRLVAVYSSSQARAERASEATGREPAAPTQPPTPPSRPD